MSLWCAAEANATALYGHISTWDTSGVANMSLLFSQYDRNGGDADGGLYCSTASTFNEDLSGWALANVTDLSFMYVNII